MVEDKTISSDIWQSIKTALVGKVYVINLALTTTTQASVVATFNDEYISKPIVEIMPINKEESMDKFGGYQGSKDIFVNINCYYSNTLGVDQMADMIEDILKTTKIDGIALSGLSTDYGVPLTPNDNKFHIKSLSLSYTRR
jgi:hypothetical protein